MVWADPENSVRGGGGAGRGWGSLQSVFGHQCISQKAVRTSLEEQLDLWVQLLLEGGLFQYV